MSFIPVNGSPDSSCGSLVPSGAEASGDEVLLQRFVGSGDQDAFSALVRRHGPMVLGVCQRVLQDRHEADDAFQATFLVLVQRAASLREPRLLAGWLYGVAYRLALKARLGAARRDQLAREQPPMTNGDPLDEAISRELRALLDAALNELPEKYRTVLVLCYLEGKTNVEAARELGWPVGSVSSRLARGREMLRERLARRHPALSGPAVPMLLLGFLKPASVDCELAEKAVRAALAVEPIAGSATEPSGQAMRAPLTGPIRRPVVIALAAVALLGMAGWLIAGEWSSSAANSPKSPPAGGAALYPGPPPLSNSPLSPRKCKRK